MYLGTYQMVIGNDRQLVVPESFRGLFSYGAFITRGFEQNLLIMSDKIFGEIFKRVVSLNIADPLARLLLRLILANASSIELNPSGKVTIPQELMSFANLDKGITLVGQGDYLEGWSPVNWEKQITNLLDTDANSERFAQLNLALHQ
jgi:MraZ protein